MPPTFVLFGASGDLTRRKLVPALYRAHQSGRLPVGTRVVGMSRTEMSVDAFRDRLKESLRGSVDSFDADAWGEFARHIDYLRGDVSVSDDVDRLRGQLDALDGGAVDRIYYLATAPSLFGPAVENLGSAGLAHQTPGAARRIVVEKPFGVDTASAQALNETLHRAFDESQVYRIDHYLGKETVQNLFVLRFANSIFEPIWNRNYIDHVQITVAEDSLVGDRGPYYEESGILRDMFQNHLLQLLMVTAMEPPTRFVTNSVRNEKVKVLEATRTLADADFATDTFRAQYDGYRNHPGVDPASRTATFSALKLHVDNWRWNGVPFYLRSGKAMSCQTTQIVVQFRDPPQHVFEGAAVLGSNRLVVQVQPAEGLQLHLQTKVPDAGMRLRSTELDVDFRRAFPGPAPDAYERLLADVANGDASLFSSADEVELAWGIIDPIVAAWESPAAPALHTYEPGLWGPEQSAEWMREQDRLWFDVCPVLT